MIKHILWHIQIIRFLKRDNKYKKRQVDRQIDIKEKKKGFTKLLAKREKAKAIEKNKQLSYISNCFLSPISNLDDLVISSDSNLLSPSIQMPRLIHYFWLLYLSKNLSWNITLNLPLLGIYEYYFAFVSTISQRMTLELKNIADSILYTTSLPFSENGTENNKGIFFEWFIISTRSR